MSNSYKASFLRKEQLTSDVWAYFFSKPRDFSFVAGQYIDMTLPFSRDNDKTRSFTIASSPLKKDIFQIVTTRGKSLFKESLFHLKVDDEITIDGPLGGFSLLNNAQTPKVFIAGGIGVTPFYSILSYISEKKLSTSITLFASFSSQKDILFKNEFDQNSLLNIVYTITDIHDKTWKGEKGRISGNLIKKYVSPLQDTEYAIAGSGDFVDSMVDILITIGIKNTQIKTDIFTGY